MKTYKKGDWKLTKINFDKIGSNICYPYYREEQHFRIYTDDNCHYNLKRIYFHCAPQIDDDVNTYICETESKKIEKCEEGDYGKEDTFLSSISSDAYEKYRKQYLRYFAEESFEVDTIRYVDDEKYREEIINEFNETIDNYNKTVRALSSESAGLYRMS
jgi:hypothetical protein